MSIPYVQHQSESNIQRYHHKQPWFQIARPLTLTGTLSPIIVGTIVASYNGSIHLDRFIVLVLAAVLVQAAANILNDYFDFANGQDADRWHMPMNDMNPDTGPAHQKLPVAAMGLLSIAAVLGVWLAMNSHFSIILIGIIGIFAGYKYSAGGHKSLSALGLGELTAAIFLGVVPVILSFIVQGQPLSWVAFAIAIPFALLISMMILTNNIRDIDKDEGFRKTIAIRFGKRRAVRLLTGLGVSVYLFVTFLVLIQVLPWTALIMYLALPVAYKLRMSFRKNATRSEEMKGMKTAAQHHWIFSILLIIGMLMGVFI